MHILKEGKKTGWMDGQTDRDRNGRTDVWMD